MFSLLSFKFTNLGVNHSLKIKFYLYHTTKFLKGKMCTTFVDCVCSQCLNIDLKFEFGVMRC